MKIIAFVCLTRGYSDMKYYDDIISRNKSIIPYLKHFNAKNIIYHEGNIPLSHQEYIISNSCQCDFVNLMEIKTKAFRDIGKVKPTDVIYETPLSKCYSIGYRHMCHFWFVDFLTLLEYDFVIRVDEDCVLRAFPLDVFENENFAFITPLYNGVDVEDVTIGLQHTLSKFHILTGTTEKYAIKQCLKNPYTNVFVMNVKFFINNEIFNKYVKYIDSSNGIYINRWGDLPLMGYFLLNFLSDKEYLIDKRISYYHKSHRIEINKKYIL